MKELVIISGKGGTGKTSLTASLAALAGNKVVVDCDVDAADLHILMNPAIQKKENFVAGKVAVNNSEMCLQCGDCVLYCRFDAIGDYYVVNPVSCEGCGLCERFCPHEAMEMVSRTSGEWYLSDTRFGPLLHARLFPAEGNSGKLVTLLRQEGRRLAEEKGLDLLLVDGSPGVGCPVIASLAGARAVLVVTEPTVSAVHDMKRVVDLTGHFRMKTLMCINRCDLNRENVKAIEEFCESRSIPVLGKIPYDGDFTKSQVAGKTLIEYSDGEAARAVRKMWEDLSRTVLH